MSQLPPAGPSEMAAADGLCPICLDDLENATYVDVCQHRFCFICIREWAKLTKTCPLCKQPFKRLLRIVTADNNHEEYVAVCSACRRRKAARARSRSPQRHYNLSGRRTDNPGLHREKGDCGDSLTAEGSSSRGAPDAAPSRLLQPALLVMEHHRGNTTSREHLASPAATPDRAAAAPETV